MPAPFDFKFEEINLLPSFKGTDGRLHRYGDHLLTGTAVIMPDADCDWWIASISVETSERDRNHSLHDVRFVYRDIERNAPEFTLFRDAIARECGEDINEAVRLHVMEAA